MVAAFDDPKAIHEERRVAKKSAKTLDRGLLVVALVVMATVVIAGMYLISIATNEGTRQILLAITMGTGGVGVIGICKMIQSTGLRKSIDDDTDTTVQIAQAVKQDLTHTQEVKRTVDEAKEKLEEVHEKVNGGMELRITKAVLEALEQRDLKIAAAEEAKKSSPQ